MTNEDLDKFYTEVYLPALEREIAEYLGEFGPEIQVDIENERKRMLEEFNDHIKIPFEIYVEFIEKPERYKSEEKILRDIWIGASEEENYAGEVVFVGKKIRDIKESIDVCSGLGIETVESTGGENALRTILVLILVLVCFAFSCAPSTFQNIRYTKGIQTVKPSGWDYDLVHRCVKSVKPGSVNYYQDITQCYSSQNWTIAVELEQQMGASFPGVVDQSYPINVPNNPIALNWLPHTDELGKANWSVELKTDFNQYTDPCGSNYFTWVAFMDHVNNGGGPLPRPDHASFSLTVNFNDFTPNGATRAFVGFQGWWNNKVHMIEIHFASTNWGKNNPNPDVVWYYNSPTLEYIQLYGPAWGVSANKLTDTVLQVSWMNIVSNLVSRSLLESPQGGWTNSATQAIWVGTETLNYAASNSVVTDLWFTNFRVVNITK